MIPLCLALLTSLTVTPVAESNGFTNDLPKAASQRSIDELVAITESLRTGLLASTRTDDDRFKMMAGYVAAIERIGPVEGRPVVRYKLTFGGAKCVMNVDVKSEPTAPSADVMIVAAGGCDGGEPR